MKNRNIHRLLYRIRHSYLTLNNVVVVIAFLIALGWVWGSLTVMQRNYTLQRTLDRKSQELQVAELETRNLELQATYFKTAEYQELAVRERLGLGAPGEKVLLLPLAKEEVTPQPTNQATQQEVDPSNFQQWMDFLFGTNRSRLQ